MLHEFIKYYKPYKKIVFLVILGSCVMSVLDLLFPIIVRNILNMALPEKNLYDVYFWSGILLSLYLGNSLVIYLINYYGHKMSVFVEKDMRRDLMEHINKMSFKFFDNKKKGQLLARATSDLVEIGELVFRGPNDIIVCCISMLGSCLILFHINVPLSFLVAFLLILKTLHTIFINRKMKQAFRDNRTKNGELTAKIEEILSGIRLVKTFACEKRELDNIMAKNDESIAVRSKSFKILGYFSASVNFFTNIINLAVLVFGSYLIINNKMQISDFVAFLLYINLFMKPLLRLTVFTEVYQRGMAGFYRFYEILQMKPEITDKITAIDNVPIKGNIVIKNLSFAYDNNKFIIKNMNLTINKGEKIAFVGMTGAGKTTITNLLLRFYDPQEGEILIDGINIKNFKQTFLRENIGLVQQDVFLFSDSIRYNITYGKFEASDKEVVMAAKSALADEFVGKLSYGYNTEIGERGVKLSGGQKQRLAIARILLKNPPIVILDEATSALDNTTEKLIQRSMENLVEGRTTIIIAHRLSTIKNVDRVFVLKNGQIIEQGNPNKLYELKGEYYKLCNSIES